MDFHVKQFFCQFSEETPSGTFHRVIPLHEAPDTNWENLQSCVPKLCKGWHELAHLNPEDRIEFTRDFWLSKLPYHAEMAPFLERFFQTLDDIGIFITQNRVDDPYEATLVYSLKDNSGFYRGAPPASDEAIAQLEKDFPEFTFPKDYLNFLQIHNGFCKTTDTTGITAAELMRHRYIILQDYFSTVDGISTTNGREVNPKMLVPFYESFGMPFFQCFWKEWYPEQEMGNVYYSGLSNTVSNIDDNDFGSKNMAFTSFSDWLIFYLEQIG